MHSFIHGLRALTVTLVIALTGCDTGDTDTTNNRAAVDPVAELSVSDFADDKGELSAQARHDFVESARAAGIVCDGGPIIDPDALRAGKIIDLYRDGLPAKVLASYEKALKAGLVQEHEGPITDPDAISAGKIIDSYNGSLDFAVNTGDPLAGTSSCPSRHDSWEDTVDGVKGKWHSYSDCKGNIYLLKWCPSGGRCTEV